MQENSIEASVFKDARLVLATAYCVWCISFNNVPTKCKIIKTLRFTYLSHYDLYEMLSEH